MVVLARGLKIPTPKGGERQSGQWPDCPKMQIALHKPTISQIQEAVNQIQKIHKGKILVYFTQDVKVRINRWNTKQLREMKVRFFKSQNGWFCYTFHSRTGYPLSYIDYEKICVIAPAVEEKLTKAAEVKLALKKFHRNAWTDYQDDPDKLSELIKNCGGFKPYSIKKNFPAHVIGQLKQVFDKKEKYSYTVYGRKRTMTVETKLCDDGIFRAWYSSEYPGYGNGSYYLLINPTTAAFREDD
ncbi:MAG: hypothetical protein A4E53_01512 [Pelotomaculum sp. PtaB.Bin104]|nr:MAG: hypothetical protein A4E53_01512 [Pelotomaculum sp. PtaB.Bin104]